MSSFTKTTVLIVYKIIQKVNNSSSPGIKLIDKKEGKKQYVDVQSDPKCEGVDPSELLKKKIEGARSISSFITSFDRYI